MRLTKHTDFALRTLLYLSVIPKGQKASVKEISEKFEMSSHHLARIVHELGKQGIIKATKGKGGGIELAKEPSEVGVGDIIRMMEETLEPINCNEPPCPLNTMCLAKKDLNDAMAAFLGHLDKKTLADWTKGKARDALIEIIDL